MVRSRQLITTPQVNVYKGGGGGQVEGALFGTGYLGYSAAKSYDKGKVK